LKADANLSLVVHTGNRLCFCLALASAGNSMAARMAMMAITTSNSISVKPERDASGSCLNAVCDLFHVERFFYIFVMKIILRTDFSHLAFATVFNWVYCNR